MMGTSNLVPPVVNVPYVCANLSTPHHWMTVSHRCWDTPTKFLPLLRNLMTLNVSIFSGFGPPELCNGWYSSRRNTVTVTDTHAFDLSA